jgi:hypothetical protein
VDIRRRPKPVGDKFHEGLPLQILSEAGYAAYCLSAVIYFRASNFDAFEERHHCTAVNPYN